MPLDERAEPLVEVHGDDDVVEAVGALFNDPLQLAAEPPAHERDARPAHDHSPLWVAASEP